MRMQEGGGGSSLIVVCWSRDYFNFRNFNSFFFGYIFVECCRARYVLGNCWSCLTRDTTRIENCQRCMFDVYLMSGSLLARLNTRSGWSDKVYDSWLISFEQRHSKPEFRSYIDSLYNKLLKTSQTYLDVDIWGLYVTS